MLRRLMQSVGIKLPPDPSGTEYPAFLNHVRNSLEQGDALVVVQRLSRCGGAKNYCLLREWDDLEALLADSPAKVSLSVCFPPALPIRGNADDRLTRLTSDLLERQHNNEKTDEGVELIRLDAPDLYLSEDDMICFDTADEINEWFGANPGVPILAGELPWWEDDSERVRTAYIPDSDGKVRPGAY